MSQQPPRILVVDDEPRICQLLGELLGREGYQTETALGADEALAKLARSAFQMVITDLKMPGMDGFGLIEAIKKIQPATACIMITAYATVETAVQALRRGADDYVTKPFDVNELKKVVGRTLQSQDLAQQNKLLVEQLQQANEELSRHKRALAAEAVRTGQSLEEANRSLSRTVEQLSAIRSITEALVSLLDLDDLLAVCLEQINKHMHVRTSSIMLLDDNKTHLVVRAASRKDIVGMRQRVGERISGWVAKYREPLLIDDIRTSGRFQPVGSARYQTASLLCIPLLLRGRLLGVVNVTDREGESPAFTDDDAQFLGMIAGQLAISIENARLYTRLQQNTVTAVSVIADGIDAREPTMMGHSQRVAEHAVELARTLGMDEHALETLGTAARIHDIGKIGICDSILSKPTALSKQELRYIRSHSIKGDRIIRSLGFLDRVRRVVRHHHERWDGAGYPDGLKGDEIPFLSRIMMIADSWDAITSGRPYRAARSTGDALREIVHCSGSQFDPNMARVFTEMQKKAAAGAASRATQARGPASAAQNASS